MRKFFTVAVMLFFTLFLSAQEFELDKLRLGGGLTFKSNGGNIGLTFNGVYEITNEWEGAVGFSHIFKSNNLSFNILDFDAHYIFFEQDSRLNFYGIGGLAFTFARKEYPVYYDDIHGPIYLEASSSTKLGLNMGIGCNYKLADNLNLAPELRFTTSNGSYVRIGASVQYLF